MTFVRAGIAALVFASVAAAQPASRKATGVIIGTVADTALRPIAGADVNFAGSAVRATTDSLGRFRVVNVPAGKFILLVRNIGFRPAANEVEISDDDTLRLAFEMEPTVHELEAVVIREGKLPAALAGFEQRRKAGLGEFFTQVDIEKINPIGVVDIVRRAKSVRISADGSTALSAREVINRPCPLAIYVDGVPLGAQRLDYLPSPKEIAAIEVYAGSATLPIWLPRGPMGTKVGCGAVLVWTRVGS